METGNITKLNLKIKKYKEAGNNNISVNKVEIGIKEENTLSIQEIEEIKELLNTNYGIEKEEIKVNEI